MMAPPTPRGGAALLLALTCALASAGCAELYVIFGPGGIFPPDGGGVLTTLPPTPDPGSGGLAGPGNTIPTTTQPAAVPAPTYQVRLLDDLLEQSAGATMIIETDLDADGVSDFASISSESQVVLLHFRDPVTQLFDQLSIAGGLPLARMVRIRAADFDGDGRNDLAVAVNETGIAPPPGASKVGTVVLIFAPADPRNQVAWLSVPLTNAFRANDELSITDLVVADFDGINGPDVAFLSNEPPPPGAPTPERYVFLFLNPGPALARDPAQWGVPRPSPLGLRPPFIEFDAPGGSQLIPSDVDGDGDIDLVANFPNAISFNVRWLENPGPAFIDPNPAAALPRWVRHFVGQQDVAADAMAVGDIDGDGNDDVAVSTNTQSLTQWFQNPGMPNVALQDYPWEVFNVGTLVPAADINQLHLADLNDDGQLDVFIGAAGTVRGFFARTGADFFDYWQPFTIVATDPPAVIGFPTFLDIDGSGTTDFVVPLDRPGLSQDQFAIFARN